MEVYSAATNQVKKTISRFRQSAYSACFRRDGQLIAAGSEEGVVKVGAASTVRVADLQAVNTRCLIVVVVLFYDSLKATLSEFDEIHRRMNVVMDIM